MRGRKVSRKRRSQNEVNSVGCLSSPSLSRIKIHSLRCVSQWQFIRKTQNIREDLTKNSFCRKTVASCQAWDREVNKPYIAWVHDCDTSYALMIQRWMSFDSNYDSPIDLNAVQESFDVFLLFSRWVTEDTSLCSHLVCWQKDELKQQRVSEVWYRSRESIVINQESLTSTKKKELMLILNKTLLVKIKYTKCTPKKK